LQHEIANLKSEDKSFYQNKVDDVIAYTRAASYTLKVVSGKEAIQLFLRSKRIQTDLSFADLMGGDKFDLQVIIRQWCPQVLPEWEFRAFIWNHQLTCCSQYYASCFVPEIHANRDKIAIIISKFYNEKIKHRIPSHVPHLTMDIALSPSLSEVIMVELGNPPPVAGTALYSWDNEVDQSIITNQFKSEEVKGTDSFDLRILDALPIGQWETLHRSVKEIICVERGLKMDVFSSVDKESKGDKVQTSIGPKLLVLTLVIILVSIASVKFIK